MTPNPNRPVVILSLLVAILSITLLFTVFRDLKKSNIVSGSVPAPSPTANSTANFTVDSLYKSINISLNSNIKSTTFDHNFPSTTAVSVAKVLDLSRYSDKVNTAKIKDIFSSYNLIINPAASIYTDAANSMAVYSSQNIDCDLIRGDGSINGTALTLFCKDN